MAVSDSGEKLLEWGGYLEACQTQEALTAKARELVAAKRDGLLTDAEYAVLVGIGKQRREELGNG